MIKVLILVCSVTFAPQDCQEATATTILQGPPAANEFMCALHGQAYLAQTELKPGPGEYLKLKCQRPDVGSARTP